MPKSLFSLFTLLLIITCKEEKRETISMPTLEPIKIDTVTSITQKKDSLIPQIKQVVTPIKLKTTSAKKPKINSTTSDAKPVKELPTSTNKNQ